jgi:SAM-dependent methyltransferase/predicted O-methyltransferase YrrM
MIPASYSESPSPSASPALDAAAATMAKPFMQEFEIKSICSALQLMKEGTDVLEWGSGNSTLYFSQYIPSQSSWTALEHNSEWASEVGKRIEQFGRGKITLRHIPSDGPYVEGVDDGDLDSFYRYVMTAKGLRGRFGVIFVDGRARVACMQVAWPMLIDDGIMVLHDAQRTEYAPGIPGNAFCLRIRHRYLQNDGDYIATLFMAKQAGVIARLAAMVDSGDPSVIVETFQTAPEIKAAKRQALPEAKPAPRPSILFINTYYDAFLAGFYARQPELSMAQYGAQQTALTASLFGDSNFYSSGMREAGWHAEDVIVNCQPLQQSWATAHGFGGTLLEVAVEQARQAKPDVIYIQDLNICSRQFLDLLRPHTTLIVGQIASPLPASADIKGLDIIVSSFPHFVERFRQEGTLSYYQPLAFEPRVLDAVPRFGFGMRPVECAFVGGLSQMHSKGYDLMEYLAREVPIEFWGYGAETLPAESAIRRRHHGEVWGREMFAVLASSKISVNRHIDVAGHYANNMRLFEATGCGSLLITDYKENLDELFEIGKEVVAYRSPEECAALIKYYIAHPAEAAAIARAGQERTLRDHCYARRMEQTAGLLERHLRYRREEGKLSMPSRVSDGHQSIAPGEVTKAMESAWKDPSIPASQRALVQQELAAMYRGEAPVPFRVLAEVMKGIAADGSSVLEVGCASGYYYEILEYLLNRRLDYTGVDYSEAMIAMARDYYPKGTFFAADGASLFFADRAFDTVISSCVLLHVPNYREHILETARVAKDFIVLSRTPVCRKRPTQHLRKYAYGVETVELVFNEDELLREFSLCGFAVKNGIQYDANPDADQYQVTYLLQRQ